MTTAVAEQAVTPTNWLQQSKLLQQLLCSLPPHQQTSSPEQTVYTPFVVLHLMVYQRLNHNATLEEAVAQLLFDFPEHLLPQDKQQRLQSLSSRTGAYSQARARLELEQLQQLAQHLFDSLACTYLPAYQGRPVFIIDGTTATLKPIPRLQQAFPPATNQHGPSVWPILHMAMAFELTSGLALAPQWGAKYGPDAQSEIALAQGLLDRLPPECIVLSDRNFGIFAFAFAAVRHGHQVLLRLTKSRFESLKKKARKVGEGRWQLSWCPSRADRANHPELPADAWVQGWLIEHPLNDHQSLYLFCSWEDSVGQLAGLYRQRWGGETNISDLKISLAVDAFCSKSEAMVEKELLVAMMSYNLTVQVRRLASKQAGVEPRDLGFKGTWSLVIAFLQGTVEIQDEATLQKKFARLLKAVGQRKLPKRKKPRSYPREAYAKRRKFPPRKRSPDGNASGEMNSQGDIK